MTAERYVHAILQPHVLPLMQWLPQEPFFNKTMLGITRQGCHKTVSTLLLPLVGLPPEFVSNRAYLGSFETASWHPPSLNEPEAR
ncbi:UNVERIFIED_CONTAM: hypothetical protein NCL1_51966 [Trichonephila clavipes]